MLKKLLIALVAVLVLGSLAYVKFDTMQNPDRYGLGDTPKVGDSRVTGTAENEVPSTGASENSSSVNVDRTFTLNNPLTGSITRKGVIEIGASGFNFFVVDIANDGNYKMISKTFGKSLALEGFASPEALLPQVRENIGLISEQGVQAKHIHFVISSGALKNPETDKLVKAAQKLGYFVNKITASDEGKYAAMASIPLSYKSKAFSVDMGSGNTKVTYYDGNRLVSKELPGAKYYTTNLSDDDVRNQIRSLSNFVPENLRQTCFIIGGTPYEMSQKTKDIRYEKLLSPNGYDHNTTNRKFQCGLTIYEALYDVLNPKEVVFDYDANFSIGFLISLR